MFDSSLMFMAQEKSGLQIILPEWSEVFWGALSFAVLFVLLAKFAYPAMKKGLEKRSHAIEDDLKKAEGAKLEAEQVLVEYRTQLANAQTEVNRIIEEGRKRAEEMQVELRAKAEAESERIIESGRQDVSNSVTAAKADLSRQIAELSVDLAGRILSRELDVTSQRQTIDDFIRGLEGMEAKTR